MLDSPQFTPSPDGLAISISDLNKTYRASHKRPPKQALSNVSLQIPVGRVFGLLGPNGAGKSTLINILAGTVIKTQGQVRVWGTDIDQNPRQARSNIGIVPQELNIDAFFTPRETLDIQAGMFGVPAHERRTATILELIGLTDQAESYARTLSGGMRRRLLVGKAMVHQPPVLVLDEPTAGVDVALRQRLWDMIRALNAQGVTIILTTHYLEEAEALCDEIAILNHGRVITQQKTIDLLAGAGTKQLSLTLISALKPRNQAKCLKAFQTRLDAQTSGRKATIETNVNTAAEPKTELMIRYDPAALTAGAIIAAAAESGFEIADINTAEPDLEDVFLTLTKDA
ncbi:MAG: ABC transporter ATP-binding protein [Alphaproteobacteria bacterium]|nr:ABC transporter ATP-binding protein [Alphaproteobacteria bacterium]